MFFVYCLRPLYSMEKAKFRKVASYQYSSEAIIFKGKLESEGIQVFMRDNHTIDTDPLVSNAIGGVKLFVKEEDFTKATTILESISKYEVDNQGLGLVCPSCKEKKAMLVSVVDDAKSFLSMLIALLFIVLPFYVKRKYKCDSCGFEFETKK